MDDKIQTTGTFVLVLCSKVVETQPWDVIGKLTNFFRLFMPLLSRFHVVIRYETNNSQDVTITL